MEPKSAQHTRATSRYMLFYAGVLFVIVMVALVWFGLLSSRWSNLEALPAATQEELASDAPSANSKPAETPSRILRERDFGAWRYVAGQGPKGPAVLVFLANDSVSGLEAYAAANRELAKQLARPGSSTEVVITFRTYVAPDQFRVWARAKKLEVEMVEVRTGGRGTLFIGANKDDPLPQSSIADEAVVGVYSVRCGVAAERLPEIASDPLVFVADVTSTVARRDLAEAGIAGADNAEVRLHRGVFWSIENLGLGNFSIGPAPTTVPLPVGTAAPSVP